MTIPHPQILLNFTGYSPHLLDPRVDFGRASVGHSMQAYGQHKLQQANVMRPVFNPKTRVSHGIFAENNRTNLILQSEDFATTWTATTVTVTTNSTTAPDGNVTADTLAVTGASGNVAQAVTITAGNAVCASVYFKKNSNDYGLIRIFDGSNTLTCWFNISAGTVGAQSGSIGNLTYSIAKIEDMDNGWWRCMLNLTTVVATAITMRVSASSADNTEPANGNNIYAWGAQLESPGTTGRCSSYIPTTTTTVTRAVENLIATLDSRWFNAAEGTMYWEWIQTPGTQTNNVTTMVFGGVGNTFNDTIYVGLGTDGWMRMSAAVGGVGQAANAINFAALANTGDLSLNKMIISWKTDSVYMVINAGTPNVDTLATIPTGLVRMNFSGAPWQAAGGNNPNQRIRRAAYWNEQLAQSVAQTLTKV